MNKLITAICGTAVAIAILFGVQAIAASPISTNTGKCFDGSTWTLTLTRSGSKVVSNFTVSSTLKKAKWVVNYAYIPQNQVNHQFVNSDSRGILKAKSTFYSNDKTGLLIMTDNRGVTYCNAYGEI